VANKYASHSRAPKFPKGVARSAAKERACYRKIPFKSVHEARADGAVAAQLDQGRLRLYRCPHCKNFHLATVKKEENK